MDIMVDGPCGKNGASSDLEDGELIDDEPQELLPTLPPDEEKKILRAKRFGISGSNASKSKDPEVYAIQKKMGLGPNARTNTLHLHGTDDMKLQDFFEYFGDYNPASIEWLGEKSCNVSWLDEETCAKALKKYSTHIRGQLASIDYDDEEEESLSLSDVRIALPPGTWRKGVATPLAPHLLIRYATFSDKRTNIRPPPQNDFDNRGRFIFADEGDEGSKPRVRGDASNPWSDLATQWGNFEHKSAVNKQPVDPRSVVRDARDGLSKYVIRDARQLLSQPLNTDYHVPTRRKMIADMEERQQKRIPMGLGGRVVDLRDRISRKRGRTELDHRRRGEGDEVGAGIHQVMQKLVVRKDLEDRGDEDGTGSSSSSSSSSSTSSSSSSSSSSTSGSSSSSSSSSEDSDSAESFEQRKKVKRSAHGKVCKRHKAHVRRSSHVKKSKIFNPSPLRIEIDNDFYYKNGGNHKD